MKTFLEHVLLNAVLYTGHRRAKTVTPQDVVHALRREGTPLYGFDGDPGSWHGALDEEERASARLHKRARELALEEHTRLRRAARAAGRDPNAVPVPPNAVFLAQARASLRPMP